jgi:hypothetical protein
VAETCIFHAPKKVVKTGGLSYCQIMKIKKSPCVSSFTPLIALFLIAATLVLARGAEKPAVIEVEQYAADYQVHADDSASGGKYATRLGKDGRPVARLYKIPVPQGTGEVTLWVRGRNFSGMLELRTNEAEREFEGSKSISKEVRKRGKGLKMKFPDEGAAWTWINLGRHDFSGTAVMVAWAHADCHEGRESGLDCLLLAADASFVPGK